MKEEIYIDPAFLRKSNYSYVNYQEAELSSVLCFALARNNSDLILHQQRIEHNINSTQKNVLFTAIVDLFTALGHKGDKYKSRMLNKYRKKLTSQQTVFLTKSLAKGIDKNQVVKDLNQSLLNFGNIGKLLTADVVRKL